METVFNLIFLMELVINAYGHWFWEFWKSGWNKVGPPPPPSLGVRGKRGSGQRPAWAAAPRDTAPLAVALTV